MSKRLKLAGLSTSRALRSGKTLVNADSSEKTSPYFNERPAKTKVEKRTPVKIEHKATDETNIKGINVISVVKSEDAERLTDITDIKTEVHEMKNESIDQSTDPKNVKNEKQWMPSNWEAVLENIKEMRKHGTAPVDTMGCHKCADPNASPIVSRYQSLVALMLSSQTKDQVTHAAMQRLNTYGCKPDIIAATSDDVLGKLIYPVGFWKVKTNADLFTKHFGTFTLNFLYSV